MQVCRNINQIKVCMETGRTVILLNLENIYESLYDLLNQVLLYLMHACSGVKCGTFNFLFLQYYIRLGDARYVDLGLQTHRVKCRVHDNFKYA